MRLFISMVYLPGLVLCLFKRNAFVKVQETGKTKLKMDGSPFKWIIESPSSLSTALFDDDDCPCPEKPDNTHFTLESRACHQVPHIVMPINWILNGHMFNLDHSLLASTNTTTRTWSESDRRRRIHIPPMAEWLSEFSENRIQFSTTCLSKLRPRPIIMMSPGMGAFKWDYD